MLSRQAQKEGTDQYSSWERNQKWSETNLGWMHWLAKNEKVFSRNTRRYQRNRNDRPSQGIDDSAVLDAQIKSTSMLLSITSHQLNELERYLSNNSIKQTSFNPWSKKWSSIFPTCIKSSTMSPNDQNSAEKNLSKTYPASFPRNRTTSTIDPNYTRSKRKVIETNWSALWWSLANNHQPESTAPI